MKVVDGDVVKGTASAKALVDEAEYFRARDLSLVDEGLGIFNRRDPVNQPDYDYASSFHTFSPVTTATTQL